MYTVYKKIFLSSRKLEISEKVFKTSFIDWGGGVEKPVS